MLKHALGRHPLSPLLVHVHRTGTGEIKDRSGSTKIRELSVAPLLAEAIYRVHKAMPFAELLTWNDPVSFLSSRFHGMRSVRRHLYIVV